MLDQLAKHSLIDIKVRAKGDLHIDFHHTAEDVGIALGEAVKKALGDKKGIRRYASADLVMDGTLTRVALDVSGRPFLVWKVEFTRDKVGEMDTELFREWFQAFAMNAGITLHVETFYGDNNHHIAEVGVQGAGPGPARRGRDRPARQGPDSEHQGHAVAPPSRRSRLPSPLSGEGGPKRRMRGEQCISQRLACRNALRWRECVSRVYTPRPTTPCACLRWGLPSPLRGDGGGIAAPCIRLGKPCADSPSGA